ncbi:AAA-ATPase At3g50940-like [Phragmites australis]|uniref:AAA-ATPase At3g50940-like n=1 Tax=Phragmites australis TaxID=29695 RepID=UPI002D764D2C|nr:AAA-ATPase At3g50940-like [Phragmites australis]
MDLSSMVPVSSQSYGKAVDAYKKAVAAAATVTAYSVLARGMARELLPDELRAAARWAASLLLRGRPHAAPEHRTIVIKQREEESRFDNGFYADARAYLATRIDPHAMSRICLSRRGGGNGDDGGGGGGQVLSMEVGGSMTDVFEGVEFTWESVKPASDGRFRDASLELSFDAEHTDMALGRYIPFITAKVEEARQRERALKIFSSETGSWRGSSHQHPATFDTLAMDPELKQSVLADLDRFLERKDYYRRIGKAWKRGYLLYGPPGTGKSSLVAAIANYLRFNLYDLDLSAVHSNSTLQWLLTSMPNKSILVIEDIDCCFDAASREDGYGKNRKASEREDGLDTDYSSDSSDDGPQGKMYRRSGADHQQNITLSGLLNFIDGLWSTSGEERIFVFTTNYKDRLDPALLRPGRMDMHVYMGYCGWEAFRTLARNYFLVVDHPLFLEIEEVLTEVEVTPAEVSEMLLRSEDVDVALRVLSDFLREKRRRTRKEETEDKNDIRISGGDRVVRI